MPNESLNDYLPLSPDLNAERLGALKKLFPDLFSNEGRLNPDELKKLIDPALVSDTERYEFRWYGKTASKREAFTPSRAALVFDKARSVNPAKAGGNMIIEGENLEVLKLLSSAYRERIKCIYIDPPYNIGEDRVYRDDYSEGRERYWEQTAVTENGVSIDTNSESSGRHHSNWLSMMHSRLLIARYLLAPSGVILVSIDNVEAQNLKRLLDEVFGDENFIGVIIWNSATDNNPTRIATEHEYIFCYARSLEATEAVWKNRTDSGKMILLQEYETIRRNPLLSNEDVQKEIRAFIRTHKEALSGVSHYDRVDENGLYTGSRKVHNPKPGGYKFDVPFRGDPTRICVPPVNGYRYPPVEMQRLITEERFIYGEDENQIVQIKEYLKDYQAKLSSVISDIDSRTGSNELTKIFGEQKVFKNPKPSLLLSEVLDFVVKPGDTILDFFGGSGSTAHAVWSLNTQTPNAAKRKVILVQFPEKIDEKETAYRLGFRTISAITMERCKRVIQGFGDAPLPLDEGFKVFKLAKSNFPRVEFAPDPDKTEAENIELLKQYIREKEATFHIQWERETVLDEVLLKQGFMLDYTLTRRPEFTKNEVFLAKDGHKESLICLDAKLAPETVDHFKTHKEHFFVCLELALDTTRKWNLKQHLGEKLKTI
jgi:adenine-specific DNA-methyltransferase